MVNKTVQSAHSQSLDLPVARIPPVCIEMAISEPCQLCERAKYIFEDYEENKQEDDHEGKEEHADGFGKDESLVGDVGENAELGAGLCQHGDDELLASQGEQENAAKYGSSLPANF